MSTVEDRNIALAKEYFVRGDARRPDLLELFHPDFQLYFPKFGVGRGTESYIPHIVRANNSQLAHRGAALAG
jgi:hypothetical protein